MTPADDPCAPDYSVEAAKRFAREVLAVQPYELVRFRFESAGDDFPPTMRYGWKSATERHAIIATGSAFTGDAR